MIKRRKANAVNRMEIFHRGRNVCVPKTSSDLQNRLTSAAMVALLSTDKSLSLPPGSSLWLFCSRPTPPAYSRLLRQDKEVSSWRVSSITTRPR